MTRYNTGQKWTHKKSYTDTLTEAVMGIYYTLFNWVLCYINGLAQHCSNPSALPMTLLQSYTKPLIKQFITKNKLQKLTLVAGDKAELSLQLIAWRIANWATRWKPSKLFQIIY